MKKLSIDEALRGFEPLADVTAINTLAAPGEEAVLRLDQLAPYDANRAVREDAVVAMAGSLRREGQLQNLLVRPHPDGGGLYQICAGHHRWLGQLRNAAEYPDNPAYRTLKATVRMMSDVEMEVANIVANYYMVPPSAEERGAMYETLVRRVPQMRAENPERFGGVPTAQIVADLVNELGGSTSRTSVNRDLKAAREALGFEEALRRLTRPWQKASGEGRLDKAGVLKLAALDPGEQDAVWRDWEGHGATKSYLAERIACTDADGAEQLALRALKTVAAEVERLARIRSLGYSVDGEELCRARELLEGLQSPDPERRRS